MDGSVDRYLSRTLEGPLRAAASQFSVVTLTGPRQSGKTTLLKHLFSDDYRYVSVDTPEARRAIGQDPRGFFEAFPPPVIFDEIQASPELLPYIRERVDSQRSERAQFVLSGSQNILLSEKVSETLAGRTAVLRLLPFTGRELDGEAMRPWPWDRVADAVTTGPGFRWERLLRGFYPQLARDERLDEGLWYSSYLQTFVERDVRSFRQVGDLTQFQIFLRVLAARSAQLLNLSELSRDLGIAVNTAKAWLSMLEACYLVVVVRPWYENIGKRMVKTPKVYFLDPGLLCHLVGISTAAQARNGPMAGALMETSAITEVYRGLTHLGQIPRLYFWRTSAGREIDLLLELPGRLIPVEIKATATPLPKMAESLGVFRADYPRAERGWLLHGGGQVISLGEHAIAWPVAAL